MEAVGPIDYLKPRPKALQSVIAEERLGPADESSLLGEVTASNIDRWPV